MLPTDTIYYDGHCGLCHGFVKFVLVRDVAGRFRFSPIDRLPAAERNALPDSIVVRTPSRVLVKSDAALYVLSQLSGFWALVSRLSQLFPRFIRDFVYAGVARVRYLVFGRRVDVCPIVPEEFRNRFNQD